MHSAVLCSTLHITYPQNDNTLGTNATIKFDAWIPPSTSAFSCIPYSLTITAGAGGMKINISAPERGWKAGQWNSLEAPILHEDSYIDANKAAWADLNRLEVSYNCLQEAPQEKGMAIKVGVRS